MKRGLSLLLFFISILAGSSAFSSAEAYTCFFDLLNSRGREIRTFSGYDYNRPRAACRQARRRCQNELDFRRRTGRGYGEYCQRQGRRRLPYPPRRGRYTCLSEMRTYRGDIIRTFRARGYNRGDACRKARRRCERRLNRRGGHGKAYCTTVPGRRF